MLHINKIRIASPISEANKGKINHKLKKRRNSNHLTFRDYLYDANENFLNKSDFSPDLRKKKKNMSNLSKNSPINSPNRYRDGMSKYEEYLERKFKEKFKRDQIKSKKNYGFKSHSPAKIDLS